MKTEKIINSPMNIILLGDPAAGKLTQSAYLTKKFKMYDFDMGRELNKLRKNSEEVNSVLGSSTDQGKLSPTGIVRNILKEVIANVPLSQGILFDGHPKMLGEAKIASQLLKEHGRNDPLVLYLSIPMSETVKRIGKRAGYFNGKFGKRADDSSEALKNRVRYYRKNIAQVKEFYSRKYKFININGLGNKTLVRLNIEKAIKEFLT